MNDIAGLCERLRACDTKWLRSAGIAPLFNPNGPEAADTLERQAAEIARLRGALRPFGAEKWGYLLPDATPIFPAQSSTPTGIVAGDFRRARTALTGEDA
jgi:hypothetical protein